MHGSGLPMPRDLGVGEHPAGQEQAWQAPREKEKYLVGRRTHTHTHARTHARTQWFRQGKGH